MYKATSGVLYINKINSFHSIKTINFTQPIKIQGEFLKSLTYTVNAKNIILLAKTDMIFRRFNSPTNSIIELAVAYKKYLVLVSFYEEGDFYVEPYF
jgi:hypothetical protein